MTMGVRISNVRAVNPTSNHSALPKSPKVQKTTAAICSVVPKYCRRDVSAENRYVIAIPANIVVPGLTPLYKDNSIMVKEQIIEKEKALRTIRYGFM